MDKAAILQEALLDALRTRKWRPRHRLPTERQLSIEYELSRSAVRRVLARMKEQGLIRQTVGSGTYVTDDVEGALQRLVVPGSAPSVSPADLMGARLVLEPAIVELVIGSATADDFMQMDECCARGEAAGTLEEFEHWDAKLHEAIAAAAHNVFVLNVLRLMNEVRMQGEWGLLKRRSATPQRRVEYQREHRELVAALKHRDAERASQLCLAHLMHVRKNMLGW